MSFGIRDKEFYFFEAGQIIIINLRRGSNRTLDYKTSKILIENSYVEDCSEMPEYRIWNLEGIVLEEQPEI